jgi:hydrogenase maturation protein HypF
VDNERRAITVQGVVQGVGFRPFVHGLANRLGLAGFVRNDAGEVCIEVEGPADILDEFFATLTRSRPPLARVAEARWEPRPARGDQRFEISVSTTSTDGPVYVSPDVATCDACLAELFNPTDRRFRYPFLNCTNCGPRLTIVTGAPYDRARTTMWAFPMCEACQREYEDPGDRRFHAQPTCCAECGPRLRLHDAAGRGDTTTEPLAAFVESLRDGRIGALKGLGGYHLTCDALTR